MGKEIKTIHERMSLIKAELCKCEIPKSGHNKYAGFKYHELQDFMPFVNELNAKHGVNAIPRFLSKDGICVIKLVNTNDSSDYYEIVIPYVDAQMLSKGGGASTVDAIQRLGSTITYNRRYLYMAAYDITESDSVDGLDNSKNIKTQSNNTGNGNKSINRGNNDPAKPKDNRPFVKSGTDKAKQLTELVESGQKTLTEVLKVYRLERVLETSIKRIEFENEKNEKQ